MVIDWRVDEWQDKKKNHTLSQYVWRKKGFGFHRKVFTTSLFYPSLQCVIMESQRRRGSSIVGILKTKLLVGIETCSAFVYNDLITRKP